MNESQLFTADELPVVETRNAQADGHVVLACEHASAAIPASLEGLGLAPEARLSHVAWDPGALEVAEHMAAALNAPLVASRVSRLVLDCNRPPEAPDAIPEVSEVHEVPGNRGITQTARAIRAAEIYEPFHARLGQVLDSVLVSARAPVLVTVHSFTPVYRGKPREVEIGFLHDADSRLVDALLAHAGQGPLAGRDVRRNAPYGPGDGVMHTLRRHGEARGLLHVMIEIRNDVIGTEATQADIGRRLATALQSALDGLAPASPSAGHR